MSKGVARSEKCPFCAERILAEAKKCKHCGEFLLKNQQSKTNNHQTWNPGTAAVLNVFLPGVGHIYKGKLLDGFLWMIFVPIGYLLFIVPGIILHVLCIVDAQKGYNFPVAKRGGGVPTKKDKQIWGKHFQ